MTERLGLVGLTQVDFGLDKRLASSLGVSERVVLVKGLSWSDKDGFFFSVFGCAKSEGDLGGDLEELQ